jgi:hypothetical protein
MDPSYVTHQRRFALIPNCASLNAEDEQAVRLRTGDVIPAASSAFGAHHIQANKQYPNLESHLTPPAEDSHSRKRKASTTAEEYQAACSNTEEAGIDLESLHHGENGHVVSTFGEAMNKASWDMFQGANGEEGVDRSNGPLCETSLEAGVATIV